MPVKAEVVLLFLLGFDSAIFYTIAKCTAPVSSLMLIPQSANVHVIIRPRFDSQLLPVTFDQEIPDENRIYSAVAANRICKQGRSR